MALSFKQFTEEDRLRLAALGAQVLFNTPSHWVVWDEQDVQLVAWGGQGWSKDRLNNHPDHYTLSIRGRLVNFEVWRSIRPAPEGRIYDVEIEHMAAPAGADRVEIEQLAAQGLLHFWRNQDRTPISGMHVTFPAEWTVC